MVGFNLGSIFPGAFAWNTASKFPNTSAKDLENEHLELLF